jgi:hypothetical protein
LRMISFGDVHPLSDPVNFTPMTCRGNDNDTNES